MTNHPIHFILYVSSQQAATAFYTAVLGKAPVLNVPGMTEILLNDNCKLGLMPTTGIAKILDGATPHPDAAAGIPRCELYIYTQNLEEVFANAVRHGAKVVSQVTKRDWGDLAGYLADHDGHIIAFAEKAE